MAPLKSPMSYSSSMTRTREIRLNGVLQLLKSRRVAQALTAPRTSRRERSRMRLLHSLRYTRMTAVPKTPLSPRVPLTLMIRRRTGISDTGSNRPSARSLPQTKSLISSTTTTARKTQTELKYRANVLEWAFRSFLSLQREGAPSRSISIRSKSACPDVKQNFLNFQAILYIN